MTEAPGDGGTWPAKLASLAALVGADALAVVLAIRDGNPVTYAHHNIGGTPGWENAGDGAVVQVMTRRTPGAAAAEIALGDGRTGRSLCAVPIVWQDAVLGALVALRATGGWEEVEAADVSRAAELVALELAESTARWRDQQVSGKLAARERVRGEMQRELASLADPQAILEYATRRVSEIFAADGVSMMLVEGSGDLVTRSAVGMREDVVKRARRRVGEGISGWVAKAGQALLLSGKVEDARFSGVDPSIGGALVAPLRAEDRILGVVNVKARTEGQYGQEQLADLTSVATDVAAALDRADAMRRVEEDRRQAMVLYELSRLVAQGGDAQANLDLAAGMLADTLRHDVLGVWIAEGGEEKLRLRASRGYGDTLPGDVTIALEAALQGAFGERRPQRVKLEALRPAWASARSGYYLLAPIISGTQAIGVLVVGRADGSYAEMDLQFTTTLGEYLGGLVQRAASSDELQTVAAGERRRIAQELHDGLAQELTGVVLALEGCQRALERDPDGVPKQLAKAARDARACLADIRQYMTALRQHDGSALTLPVTVSRLVDDLRRTAGLSVEVEKFGAERTLPTQVERSIVRIAQEALHNVSQHAQASKAKVVLHYDDNEVTLTIEDDGQGFAVEPTIEGAEQGGRFGMLGMRERAEGIGGRLHVRSEPGAGTVVQARIPYDAPRLAAVPSWPTPPRAAPPEDATPGQGDEADELEQRSGFLQRLFGR